MKIVFLQPRGIGVDRLYAIAEEYGSQPPEQRCRSNTLRMTLPIDLETFNAIAAQRRNME